jgi:hypothetical protein
MRLLGWCLRQRRQPALHRLLRDLMDEAQVTLGQQILLHISKHHLMPVESFGVMSHFTMSLLILLDSPFHRQTLPVLS